jgi:hypothetical protein
MMQIFKNTLDRKNRTTNKKQSAIVAKHERYLIIKFDINKLNNFVNIFYQMATQKQTSVWD